MQQMDHIYVYAESLIAWIGDATISSEVVLEGLSKVDGGTATNGEFEL
jgi:hypothetical protein